MKTKNSTRYGVYHLLSQHSFFGIVSLIIGVSVMGLRACCSPRCNKNFVLSN